MHVCVFVETMGGERVAPNVVSSSTLYIEVYKLVNIQEESALEMWEWSLGSSRRTYPVRTTRFYQETMDSVDNKQTEVEIM